MPRLDPSQLAFPALRIKGGLIPADELARLTLLQSPAQTEQTERHYTAPKGLALRDEIARHWKIAQNLWVDLQPLRQRSDLHRQALGLRAFLVPLLRDVLGFSDLATAIGLELNAHRYPVGHAARGGRLSIALVAPDQELDAPAEPFEAHPETGRIRRRSPFMLANTG